MSDQVEIEVIELPDLGGGYRARVQVRFSRTFHGNGDLEEKKRELLRDIEQFLLRHKEEVK